MKRYRIRADSASWLIDQTELVGIARRGSARRVPWCSPLVAGLVDTEFGIVGLLAPATPTEPLTPEIPDTALCAVVQLCSGRIAIDIAQIEELSSESVGNPPPRLTDHLNALTRSFGVSLPAPAQLPESTLVGSGSREVFLHVRSGSAQLAIPAKRIYRLDKHLGVRPIQPDDPIAWVVQLDNELLCATSLATQENSGLGATEEPWCLCLDHPADARALLVAEVLGLIDVPGTQVKSLRQSTVLSRWIARPGHEPLRILSDSAPLGDTSPTVRSDDALRPDGQHNAVASTAERALTVFSGRYRIAFPDTMLGMVLGPLAPSTLHQVRQGGDLPVVDLAKLLGDHAGVPGQFAVTLKIGRCQVVIVADHAEIAAAEPVFSGVPSLPDSIFAYLRGIRLIGPDCELLANEQLTRQQKKALIQRLPQDAFLGWMPQPF